MSVIGSNILAGSSGQGGYFLTNSLRFRSSASAYLNRTPASSGNLRLWTLSWWTKRGQLSTAAQTTMFGTDYASSQECQMQFTAGNKFVFEQYTAAGATFLGNLISTQVFRDPSAWYHIVVAWDSAQATASNRIKVYINGTQITAWDTASYPAQNADSVWNQSTNAHFIGKYSSAKFYDGYQTEINFIDGQALTPSSFGQTSATTGVWIPKKYSGTYGTNGFYLPFTDNSALTTSSNAGLGKDFSGNGNYWTTNNISITSGTTYDSMTDVPTLTSATASNFSVMNPLTSGTQTTLTGANLNLSQSSGSNVGNSRSTFAMTTGKWYMEVTLTANASSIYPQIGIMTARDGSRPNNDYPQAGYSTSSLDPTLSVIYMADGQKQTNGSSSSYGSSFTNGDVIGVAIDSDNGAIYFSKNGTFQNSGVPTSGSSKTGAALTWTGGTVDHVLSIAGYNGTAESANFGQRPFAYTPPTGFVALNTFNLPTPTIGATASTQANKYFDAVLWTGNGSSPRSFTGWNFAPDFVWMKGRSSATDNALIDSIRGTGNKVLESNLTDAENNYGLTVSSFDSNGFTASTGSFNFSYANTNLATYVGWAWKANGTPAVTNTAGSITSTVSANTTAGFSIVTYTGTGANATVGHGLGVAPSFIIAKARNSAQRWTVYTAALGNGYYGYLNETFAFDTANASLRWNTAPTSSVFGVGTSVDVNNNTTTYVAYCFAQVAGYSAFSSYTGNGSSDGPFIFTGFRPRFVMIKSTVETSNWFIYDTARNTYNAIDTTLFPSASNADYVDSTYAIDVVSNGFKIRGTGQYGGYNNNGNAYVYACFAENPFKYANAR